jgi:hypothetical protein
VTGAPTAGAYGDQYGELSVGGVLPARTSTTWASALSPPSASAAVARTTYSPAVAKVCTGEKPLAVVPSPKSQPIVVSEEGASASKKKTLNGAAVPARARSRRSAVKPRGATLSVRAWISCRKVRLSPPESVAVNATTWSPAGRPAGRLGDLSVESVTPSSSKSHA